MVHWWLGGQNKPGTMNDGWCVDSKHSFDRFLSHI
jgi:hypothetical protein